MDTDIEPQKTLKKSQKTLNFFSEFCGFKKPRMSTDIKPRMDTDNKPRMSTDENTVETHRKNIFYPCKSVAIKE